MWIQAPDHFILLGARAFCAAAGMILLAAATFKLNRNTNNQQDAKLTLEIFVRGEDTEQGGTETNQQDEDNVKPSSLLGIWIILRNFGWALLLVSQLISLDSMWSWHVDFFGILASALFYLMGLTESDLRLKYMPLRLPKRRPIRLPLTSIGWILQGLILVCSRNEPLLSKLWCLIGCTCIALSPLAFDRAHLPARVPEQQSDLDNDERELIDHSSSSGPVVFHLGGPLLAFGMFVFWVGINAVNTSGTKAVAIPFFLTGTSLSAYGGATVAFLVWWSAAYTLDEMPLVELSPSNHQRVTSNEIDATTSIATMSSLRAELYKFECKNPGFGFRGRFFGTMRQSKFAIFVT
jgi:hypothetical protein